MIGLIWCSLPCWKAWILPHGRVCFGGKKKFISVLTIKFDSLAIIFYKKKVKLNSEQSPVYSWEICQTHCKIHMLNSDIFHSLIGVSNGFLQLFPPFSPLRYTCRRWSISVCPPVCPRAAVSERHRVQGGLGGTQAWHYQLWQFCFCHAHGVSVHHHGGLDRCAVLGTYPKMMGWESCLKSGGFSFLACSLEWRHGC